jgi:hypothetical protein
MVPRSAMPAVRRAQAQLAELDLSLWNEDTGPPEVIDDALDLERQLAANLRLPVAA